MSDRDMPVARTSSRRRLRGDRRRALPRPASVPPRACMAGSCTKAQVQAWALNRYYYQSRIPMQGRRDRWRACDDPALRRAWRQRIVDHDGDGEGDGGIARWLKLTDGLGLDRDYVVSTQGVLPGDALCRRRLCPFRARAQPPGGDRLLADRAVLAQDHRRARRRHAGELRLRHAGDARLFHRPPRPGAARRRRSRSPMCGRARATRPRRRIGGARRRSIQMRRALGACSTRWITPMSSPGTCRPAPCAWEPAP